MTQQYTKDQVGEKFHEIVCHELVIKDFNLFDEWGDDLGGDSLDLVDVVISLEDEYEIEIPDDHIKLDPNFRVIELLNILEKELDIS